jgi:tRNA G18 (ribose-2'-O)-methylase SpoU
LCVKSGLPPPEDAAKSLFMRGYFAVGVEGISKARNLGAVMRTAHAFGGSFVFTVGAANRAREMFQTDTAKTTQNLPYYDWESVDDMALPRGCQIVGVELTDDAVELPSFRHPRMAAYVLGKERGDLSPAMLERCSHVVKIPTKFCVNLSVMPPPLRCMTARYAWGDIRSARSCRAARWKTSSTYGARPRSAPDRMAISV